MKIIKNTKTVELPPEIVRMILLKINDTKSYLNSRIVCKYWNIILKNIKTFENNQLKYITKLNLNSITTFNLNNQIIKNIQFKKYGDYEISYFKNNVIKKKLIHNAPHIIEEIHYSDDMMLKKVIYNHKSKSVVENNYNVCTIS